MKIFSVITSRDPDALRSFVEKCVVCKSTGVTLFTRPAFVQPIVQPGMPSEADLQASRDAAAARRDYKEAARIQEEIEELKNHRSDLQRMGAQWVTNEVEPIKNHTALIVVGNLFWKPDEPFTASAFLAKLETLSASLLTTGIAGVVQQTPLLQRTYIPIISTAPVGITMSGAAPPVVTAGDAPKPRHPSIPADLTDKEAEYASLRLGLDRGGNRRSRNEAGNSLGWSSNIAAKFENAVAKKWTTFLARVNENSVTV